MEEGFIGGENVDKPCEGIIVAYLEASTTSLETLGFLELLILWTENDGLAPDSCLEGVVDADTKAASNVTYSGIAVDAAEQSKTIDDDVLRVEV